MQKDSVSFEKFKFLNENSKLNLTKEIADYLLAKEVLERRIQQEYNIQIGNFVGEVC